MILKIILYAFLSYLLLYIVFQSSKVTKIYIKVLISLFEYGRKRKDNKNRNNKSDLNADDHVIIKNSLILTPDGPKYVETNKNEDKDVISKVKSDVEVVQNTSYIIESCMECFTCGFESIIEDDCLTRLETKRNETWNFMTRSKTIINLKSWDIKVIWIIGIIFRWLILLPMRMIFCFFVMMFCIISTTLAGSLPKCKLTQKLCNKTMMQCSNLLTKVVATEFRFHNTEHRPTRGICVANHTTVLDVVFLTFDNHFSLSGQKYEKGPYGVLRNLVDRVSNHIWFNRAESKDLCDVLKRFKEHVSKEGNPPILIFAEGTCTNNTSVMQFRKGCFEVENVVNPIAVKFDLKFSDAYWNSSRVSVSKYLLMLMTSWGIVCDVWYLPAMIKDNNENVIEFSNRVKTAIAKQAGLDESIWDGLLKRKMPKEEWKENQQKEFANKFNSVK